MPMYEYECEDCGVRFERRQSFSDEPVSICPECNGHVHRLIQPAGIIFKGSGFYVNDSRGSKKSLSGGSKSDTESKKVEGQKKDKNNSSTSSSDD